MVEAPDWKPTKECGNGLHGWLWGAGNWGLKAKGDNIKWLVLEVEKDSIIDLDGKVKFPKANVVASFSRWADAMKFIRAKLPQDKLEQIATGNYGHASATGNSGWAIAGYSGRVKAKENGVITAIYSDGKRPRVLVGYVGEDGIKPDTWYCVVDGKWKEVEGGAA